MKHPLRFGVLLLLAALLTTAVPVLAQDTPTTAYRTYIQAMAGARDLKDLEPYLARDKVAELRKMTDTQRTQGLGMLVAMMPRDVQVKKETVDGDRGTLLVEGLTPNIFKEGKPLEKSYGKVQMVREDGQWKLFHESWSDKPAR